MDRIGKENNDRFIKDVKLKDPSAAAAMSCLLPGLGQILNGQILKGITFLGTLLFIVIFGVILAVFSGWKSAILLLLFGLPIIWFYGIWDAYAYAKKHNEKISVLWRLSRLMVLLETVSMNCARPARIVAVWHSMQNSGGCL